MKGWFAWGLLAWAGTVCGAERGQEPIRFHAAARVALDDQGVPQQVQVGGKLPDPIRVLVEQRVMQWRFEPPRVDGAAKPGVTHVFLDACAVPQADGLRVAMDYRSHGPAPADGSVFPMPPRYPVSAVVDGQAGSFEVALQIGANGRVTLESVKALQGSARPFDRALRDWARALRYRPEEIDGRPVATRMVFPVDFSLDVSGGLRQWRREAREQALRSPECVAAAAAAGGEEPLRPVVLDSPFKPVTTI